MNKTRNLLGLLALAALCAGRARASEITGRVAGYVYDPTGAALSEVPLTLSGPALQQPMSRTTGDDGRYEFANVPPGGNYVIEVSVPGFSPIKETGIAVVLGQTTPLDVKLTVMTEENAAATYEIHEKVNPLLNPDSAESVNVITAEKAAESPVFHQVENMIDQAVGVNGFGSTPSTRGGLGRYTQVFVDGMDTTDISRGGITAPMNFDAVENFELITGSMDAQYNSLGAVTNMVTKTGSNKLTYDANVTISPDFATVKNKFPANNPPLFGNYFDNPAPSPTRSFYSPVLNIGGAFIPDKLWFFASYQQNFFNGDAPISLFGNSYNRAGASTSTLGRFKLTWQASEKDRVSVAFNLDRNVINNNIGFSGNGSVVTDDAEDKIHRGGEFFIVNYDHNFTDDVLFQLQTGVTYEGSNLGPIHDDYATPSHIDFNAGFSQLNYSGAFLNEDKWRTQFDPTLSWNMKGLGTHQWKAGVQTSWMVDNSLTGFTGGARYLDQNSSPGNYCDETNPATFRFCSRKVTYFGNEGSNLATTAHVSNMGAFLQDRWTINRQLTLVPGFRVDVGKLYGTTGQLLTNQVGVGPRISATYDLFADRKSLIVGHYGRANDVGNVFIAQHLNPSLTQYTALFANGAFPDCARSFNPALCTVAGGPTGRSIAPHQAAPHVDEVSLGFHHEPAEQTLLAVDFNFRRYANMWEDQEVNAIYDATGTRIIGGLNGQKQSILQAVTPASAYRDYKSMDVWVQGTPGRWDILASYTLSFATGTVSDYFDGYLSNPRFDPFYEGPIPDDRRHVFKANVNYRTDWNMTFGAIAQYHSGNPLWESFTNSGDASVRYRSPRGTGFPINSATGMPNFNDPSSWANLTNPEEFNVGFLGRYDLAPALGLHDDKKAEITFYMVNITDTAQAQSLNASYSPVASRNTFGYAGYHASSLQGEVILRFRN